VLLFVTLLALTSVQGLIAAYSPLDGPLSGTSSTINSLTLMDGELGSVCLARYRSYTFRVEVEDDEGASDIAFINISLEPMDLDITYSWYRYGAQNFKEVAGTDPNGYVSITSDNNDWSDLDANTTRVEFQLEFDWDYPYEAMGDILVSVQDNDTGAVYTNQTYFNVYKVENDLVLTGGLTAVAQHQGTITSGAWVRGNEVITFGGQSVTYQGYANRYPADDHFYVRVINSTGSQWWDNVSSGGNYQVQVTSPGFSTASVTYTIEIGEIPGGRDGDMPGNQVFNTAVDAVRPALRTWANLHFENRTHFTNDPWVYFNFYGLYDPGTVTSGVKGYYYNTIDRSGTTQGTYTTSSWDVIQMNPGVNRLYIWSVDNVGNIGNTAVQDSILVDIEAPQPGTLALQGGDDYWNNSITEVTWTGFTDDYEAEEDIAGYYYGTTNNQGTSNGIHSSGGLREYIYNGINFNTLVHVQYEGTVNHNWGNNGGPGHGAGGSTFSIIWNGSVYADETTTYNFTIGSDDGCRLYIDNELFISRWYNRPYAEDTVSVNLEKGFHRIEVHYYENNGGASVALKWKKWGAAGNPVVIPANRLWGGQDTVTIDLVSEGEHSVYAWAQDYGGNIGPSVSDTISLDFEDPVASNAWVSVQDGAQYNSDQTIEVEWDGFEDPAFSSGIRGYWVSYFNASHTDTGIWSENKSIELDCAEGVHTVYVWAEDAAGNRGIAVNDTIEVIYPALDNFTHTNQVPRGKETKFTMNLTDVVFGESALDVVLQMKEGSDPDGWVNLTVEYVNDTRADGYWQAFYTPSLDILANTIYDLRVQYSNSGGYVSPWASYAFRVVNNIPIINGSSNFTALEGEDITVDFRPFGYDLESKGDYLLTWYVQDYEDHAIESITPGDDPGIFVFTPFDDFSGTAVVKMGLRDEENQVDEEIFYFTWLDVNDPPEVKDGVPTTITLQEDDDPYPVYFDDLFFDLEGDLLFFNYSDPINLVIEQNLYAFMVNGVNNWSGSEDVEFQVNDGYNGTSIVITFIVEEINDAPLLLNGSVEVSFLEDGDAEIGLFPHVYDSDDTDLEFNLMNRPNVFSDIYVDMGKLYVKPAANWFGKVEVNVSIEDSHEEKVYLILVFNITGINDLPVAYFEHMPSSIDLGIDVKTLLGRGEDVEGSIKEYMWTSSLDGELGSQGSLDLSEVDNLTLGKHTITFKVKDGDNKWSQEISSVLWISKSIPSLEIVSIDVEPGSGVVVDDTVTITVTIRNNGMVLIENLSVKVFIDDELVDQDLYRHVFIGDEKSFSAEWTAERGSHDIRIEVMDDLNTSIEVGNGNELEIDMDVSANNNMMIFWAALIIAIVIIIIFFLVSALIRKRRKRKIVKTILSKAHKSKEKGVAMVEVEEILDTIKQEFKI